MSKVKIIPDLRFPEFKNDGEWVEKTLNEITPLIFDGTHQTPKYTENGIPFFSVENLISGKKNKFISKEDYIIATNKNKPEKFDILITRIGNIGFPKVIDWDYEFSIYVTLAVIKKSKEFNSYYLHSFIQSDFYQKEIKSKSLLNATPCKINMDELRKTKILLPPDKEHKEQQKIASCLSSLDEIIAAHSQKLNLLKDHKKGLMQNLFPQEVEKVPKYRFKEFENDGEWVLMKLENYIDLFSGIALKSEELSDDETGVPILRGINITEGYIRHSNDIDKYFLGDLENLQKYLVKEKDIVIGMDGSKVGKNVAMITKQDENSILIQRVARIRTNTKADINFVYQYFISDKFRSYVDTVNTSSGIPHISAQQIKDSKVGFPPKIQEQQKIASCLSSLDALITAQGEKIEQLKLHKKGLMQGMFPKINE
jgi:type I restriction enzyme S subunit